MIKNKSKYLVKKVRKRESLLKISFVSTLNSMDNYNDNEDIIQLLKDLDTVSVNHLELIKRSFHDCLNNSKTLYSKTFFVSKTDK